MTARVITRTQIALDQLPASSVVIDRYGVAWQERRCFWRRVGYLEDDAGELSSYELAQRRPTVACQVRPLLGHKRAPKANPDPGNLPGSLHSQPKETP